MIAALSRWWGRLWGRGAVPPTPQADRIADENPAQGLAENPDPQALEALDDLGGQPVPYDENLLERARTQWQFGDWDSLAKLERDTLQHHPDRAKLALLAAAGRLQNGQDAEAKAYIRLAQDWGASHKHVSQILVAGVHMSLGKATAMGNQAERSLRHFESALSITTPGVDLGLLARTILRDELAKTPFFSDRLVYRGVANETLDRAAHEQAEMLFRRCLSSEDLHAATDQVLADPRLQPGIRCLFLLKMAEDLTEKHDQLTATHFLHQGREVLEAASVATQSEFLKLLVRIGRSDTAADIMLQRAAQGKPPISVDGPTAKAVRVFYEQISSQSRKKSEHGHDLLLDWLKENLPQLEVTDTKRVVIEIGTTREDVPGQGSTAKIAGFCSHHGLDFITVDMDPHNTHMARQLFERKKMPFTAVTQKGEDFLRDYSGRMDFVFLDAYDFDHGHHSELRQRRYEQFLGHRINDAACHTMHLECAESVLKKLDPEGVICMDDTWRNENNQWMAKGTLAMPFLLSNGYRLIESRGQAALLTPHGSGICQAASH